VDILRTRLSDLLTFHTCPQIFILVKSRKIASGTITSESKVAAIVSVVVEELGFERYWRAISI
jgi:hypothetical protein